MAYVSTPTSIPVSLRSCHCLRYQVRGCFAPLRAQRRGAKVHDIRFLARHNTTSSIQQKYQDKLEQKAREEGFQSVDHLKVAYQERIDSLRKRVSAELDKASNVEAQAPTPSHTSIPFQQPPPPVPQPRLEQAQAAEQQQQSKRQGEGATPGIKPLASYLDLDKIRTLPNKEIEYLWRLRHANDSQSLCAVIPIETYRRIYETARTHPRFILPLPRPAAQDGSGDVQQSAQGFGGDVARAASDIHFLQWGFHPASGPPPVPGIQTHNTHTSTILFTHLAAFKLHGEFAQPHTTVTHHLDLADSHGLVLLNGTVVDGKGVSVEEGKWLLLCMQKFYDHGGHGGGVGKEKRQGLLQKFSKGDTTFDLGELVDEAERIS